MSNDFSIAKITSELSQRAHLSIPCGKARTFQWFLLVNAAVVVSLSLVTDWRLALMLLPIGALWPFIGLYFSKSLAIKAHGMTLIDPHHFTSEAEHDLYQLVESLRLRAGLPEPLQVGVYESDEVNAFATGASRGDALVAFSSGLLESMDSKAVTAVAAHEVAHIANGDMLILALVQSVINTIVLVVTLPLKAIKVVLLFSNQASWVDYLLGWIAHAVVAGVMMFLGNLVVKYFSRMREFKADGLAAELSDRGYMIAALQALGGVPAVEVPKAQLAYAAFKISAPPGWMDIFSTHPSLERRIAALTERG